jgi:hypothetical protein
MHRTHYYLKESSFALDESAVLAGCTTNATEAVQAKKTRCTLYPPSKLYLPNDDMRKLKLPVIYFPVKGSFFGLGGKSALGETAKAMLLRMGVHAMPSLDQVECTLYPMLYPMHH